MDPFKAPEDMSDQELLDEYVAEGQDSGLDNERLLAITAELEKRNLVKTDQ